MKQIKFIASGSNSSFGSFSYGDTMRCDDKLAAHLVSEARVAQYVTKAEPAKPEPAKAEPQPARPRRKAK